MTSIICSWRFSAALICCANAFTIKRIRLLNNAIEAAQRGAALTARLLAFARRQELKPVTVDAATLITNIEELLVRAVGPSVH